MFRHQTVSREDYSPENTETSELSLMTAPVPCPACSFQVAARADECKQPSNLTELRTENQS
jgi:hypothetical protein